MKRFKDLKKNDIYIMSIYLMTCFAILANFSQLIEYKNKYGNFNFGEMIILIFNDSYTGYFVFPFLLGFMIMLCSPVEENIFFMISRYENRITFYKNKHLKIVKNLICYIISICVFSIIVGIGSSNFDTNISVATKNFFTVNLDNYLGSDILIFEILKIIILQSLLLYFFVLLHAFLIQFRISQSIVFIIYTGILIIMSAMKLGSFGNIMNLISLFSLASSIYEGNLSFISRVAILILIDMMLLILNFKIFENKDIVLPKGSKQYQNE